MARRSRPWSTSTCTFDGATPTRAASRLRKLATSKLLTSPVALIVVETTEVPPAGKGGGRGGGGEGGCLGGGGCVIAVIAYDRPEYFSRVLESLSKKAAPAAGLRNITYNITYKY